jgi:hypothetical protein
MKKEQRRKKKEKRGKNKKPKETISQGNNETGEKESCDKATTGKDKTTGTCTCTCTADKNTCGRCPVHCAT